MLYRCLIRGENFPGELIGGKGLKGFYTTRWVEASSEEEAEQAAVELMKAEPLFEIKSEKVRQRAAEARIFFEEIEPVKNSSEAGPNAGATWFDM